jgi:hypothetical protein
VPAQRAFAFFAAIFFFQDLDEAEERAFSCPSLHAV